MHCTESAAGWEALLYSMHCLFRCIMQVRTWTHTHAQGLHSSYTTFVCNLKLHLQYSKCLRARVDYSAQACVDKEKRTVRIVCEDIYRWYEKVLDTHTDVLRRQEKWKCTLRNKEPAEPQSSVAVRVMERRRPRHSPRMRRTCTHHGGHASIPFTSFQGQVQMYSVYRLRDAIHSRRYAAIHPTNGDLPKVKLCLAMAGSYHD